MGHLTEIESTVEMDNGLQGAVPTEIDLGSPRNPDCRNYGICRIFFLNRTSFNILPACCSNRASGYLRKWGQSGVEVIFRKGSMSAATFEKHFGSGWFYVTDAYELSGDLSERLGIAGFIFGVGKYPVRECGGRLHVVFA